MDKRKLAKEESYRDKYLYLSALTSTLIGMLGGLVGSFSLFGFKELTMHQIIILGSIFLSIAIVAYFIKARQKTGAKTRRIARKIEIIYISHLENTSINPAVKR